MESNDALNWLLEEDQPSIRYLALTQLCEEVQDNPEVQAAKELASEKGWAADILAEQKEGGWWIKERSLYRPKYTATNWMLLILSDLGLGREDPRIRKACEIWIERFSKSDGGFGTDTMKKSELCLVGNTARALVRFGYADHARVRSAFQWLVKNQKENGGWHCWGKNGVIDAWEGMSAFAAYPRAKWTQSMKRAVERGAEFYLERKLHKQGARYGLWYRFHYPIHYYYDVLVGLDFMTSLGYGSDKRLEDTVSLLKEKQRPDGRWHLDAIHPDPEGPRYARRAIPSGLERPGEPSKMITLRAMTVLKRLRGTR